MDERDIERQSELSQDIFEARVKSVRASLPVPGVTGSDECVDCGTDIPTERFNLGYNTCIFCASKKERRS